MRRFVLLPLALALLSGLLSACDSQFTPYAARVDGASVSQASLDSALASLQSDPGFACYENKLHGAGHVAGASTGTYNAGFAASVLSVLIDAQVATHQRLRITSFNETLSRQQIIAGLQPSSSSTTSSCPESATAVFDRLPSGFRQQLITDSAMVNVLAARASGVDLTPEGVASFEAADKSANSQDCTSVIEVASLAKAQQLAIAIHGGASFATVAHANSIDPSAAGGGVIGCILSSYLVSPLNHVVATLRVGALSSPVKFHNVYLLVEVTRRSLLSPAEAALQVVLPAGTTAATTQFDALLGRADVSVDPSFGHWVQTKAVVEPPTGPPLSLIPNPKAVHATSAFS